MKKVAHRYAVAIFELADDKDEQESLLKDLLRVRSFSYGSTEFAKLLTNPLIPNSVASEIISEICKKANASDLLSNFLLLLARAGRLKYLQTIIDCYEDLYNNSKNITPAQIETSHPVSKKVLGEFKSVLEDRFSTTLKIDHIVNSNLLGGFRVKVGSNLIDFSIKTQINNLSRTLKGA